MHAYIKNGNTYMFEKQGNEADQGLLVKMMPQGKKRITCMIDGPVHPVNSRSGESHFLRTNIVVQEFDTTVVGMSKCLAFAKDIIHRYRSEGICPSCCTDMYTVLKAPKMPRCARCMIAVSIGLRP